MALTPTGFPKSNSASNILLQVAVKKTSESANTAAIFIDCALMIYRFLPASVRASPMMNMAARYPQMVTVNNPTETEKKIIQGKINASTKSGAVGSILPATALPAIMPKKTVY